MAQPKQRQTNKENTDVEQAKQAIKKFDFQKAEANDEVLQALFEMAKSGKSPTAAIFWAKVYCGISEKGSKKERKADQVPTIIIRTEEKHA